MLPLGFGLLRLIVGFGLLLAFDCEFWFAAGFVFVFEFRFDACAWCWVWVLGLMIESDVYTVNTLIDEIKLLIFLFLF